MRLKRRTRRARPTNGTRSDAPAPEIRARLHRSARQATVLFPAPPVRTSGPAPPSLSPAFMAAYEAALAETPRVEIGASRTKPGTVTAAVAGYFGSLAFASLAAGTRRTRRQILERFRAEHGEKGIATLGRAHVERMVN